MNPLQAARRQVLDAQLRQAMALHRQGQVGAAAELCAAVLQAEPDHVEGVHLLGVLACQLGDFRRAVDCLKQAVRLQPLRPSFHCNLAGAQLELGEFEAALDSCRAAIGLDPALAEAHYNAGLALLELQRRAEALDSLDLAIAHRPDYAKAHGNRGNVLQALGRPEQAVESFDRALALDPELHEAHSNRGNALQALGRYAQAVQSYDRAIQLRPRYAQAHHNRGAALLALGRREDALAAFDEAIALRPAHASSHFHRAEVLLALQQFGPACAAFDRAIELGLQTAAVWFQRGVALDAARRHRQALASYDRAIELDASDPRLHLHRGNVLQELAQPEAAVASYRQALALRPDYALACVNCGNALRALERFDEAIASYRRALELEPMTDFLQGTLLHARMQVCEWEGLDAELQSLRLGIEQGRRVCLPFPVLALIDSPTVQNQAGRIWAQAKFPVDSAWQPQRPAQRPARLRIGYYSADFHGHATAILMADLFESHDRSRFELFAFSFGLDIRDGMRERLVAAFDHFIDVRELGDEEIARLSRRHGVDIAIDLKGYTRHARPGIFASRCAPLQVNYLGYPASMGAPQFDYLIADPVLIADEERALYSEKIVRLPGSYQPNDRRRSLAADQPTRTQLGLPEAGFVFCCFNASFKILPEMFGCWMRLLQAVDGSVLWLLGDYEAAARQLRRAAQARGVDPQRLVFAPRLPHAEHLARHRAADLFLDSLPYNAHTTASDALWAGLPVLSCRGQSFASRVGASLLQAVGLPELVTNSLDEYEALALRLARDPDALADLRARLAGNRLSHPLFDTASYCRHLESAYLSMAARWQAGLSADHIDVAAQPATGPGAG